MRLYSLSGLRGDDAKQESPEGCGLGCPPMVDPALSLADATRATRVIRMADAR